MAYFSNANCSKSAISVLRFHAPISGKFYRLKILSTCHSTNAASCSSGGNKCDLIGPPHPVSNLRPIHFHIPENEAPIEKKFRLKRQEVQQWNQEFWAVHNAKFVAERKEFIAANKSQTETPLTADEMSVFYKAFLDKNWRTHFTYNFEWYKRNAQLVLLHLKVKVLQIQHRLSRPKKTVESQQKM